RLAQVAAQKIINEKAAAVQAAKIKFANKYPVQNKCEIEHFSKSKSALKIDWGTPIYTGLGTYARIKKVTGAAHQLLMVFSDGPDIRYRTSDDKGVTWSGDVIVASPSKSILLSQPGNVSKGNYDYTNAEFVELKNGWWIVSYNARPQGNSVQDVKDIRQPGITFDIRTIVSKDKGITWEDEKIIVFGGDKLERGVWEPKIIQLPNNDLQLYFADEETYFLHGKHGQQNISLMTSTDNGATWGGRRIASYRDGHRDGMPVPMISANNEILMAIEDNGQDGRFKPAIVRSSVVNSWNPFVSAGSQNRNRATRLDSRVPRDDAAGAPYIDQFPSGEIVMSAYSTQCRNTNGDLAQAIARVYIGTDQGRDFASASTPFPSYFVGGHGAALWSSVTVLDNNTVLAVAGFEHAAHHNGLYVSIGKVTRP
ncbi:MAG: exo-alpha-sialidase, partial [Lentisphaeria bacterium]|nr:exo-alpha-sialidase [Lentisphaeria bacterium]